MNGSLGESNRFILSEALAIQKGDRVTFGPMRPAQPVMGYFYDEENQPLVLINHTNVEISHTFREGMVMATILAPEGAAAIRLQLTEAEEDLFAIYINEETCSEELPSDEQLFNPLKGRNILTVGDSLCAASRDEKIDKKRGWARRLCEHFGAYASNLSQGGASFSTARMLLRPCAHPHQLILNQLPEYTRGLEYDYILLEGGANDAGVNAPIGEMSDSFDPATFDVSTFAGGFEMLIYNTIKKFGDTAAIGYMSVYKMPLAPKYANTGAYFALGEKICKKWGIAYLDFYNTFELDTEKYTWNGKEGEESKPDYVHANKGGYDLMQPHINAFMLKIRPIPLDVYNKVCK